MHGSSCPKGTLALMIGPRGTGKKYATEPRKNARASDERPLLLVEIVVVQFISLASGIPRSAELHSRCAELRVDEVNEESIAAAFRENANS